MKNRYLRLIFGDAKNKLVALIFAVVIWAVVHGSITTGRELDGIIRIEPRVGGAAVSNLSGQPDTLKVRVIIRGPGAVLDKMDSIIFRPVVNDPQVGTVQVVTLSEKDIEDLPPTVRVTDIRPDKIRVRFTRRATKKLRVTPSFASSRPAEGYELIGYTVTPSEIDASGPEDIIRAHETIKTKPIDLAGRRESFSANYDLDLTLENHFLDGPEKVQISFRIVEETLTTTVKLPVYILVPDDYPYRIKVEDRVGVVENGIVTVKIRGVRKLMEDPELLDEIRVFVKLTGKEEPANYSRRMRLDFYSPYPELSILEKPAIPVLILQQAGEEK